MSRQSALLRLFRTVCYLRPAMIWARLWRPGKTFFFKSSALPAAVLARVQNLPQFFLPAMAEADRADTANHSFCFLNKAHHFTSGTDWNFPGEGLLWNYHLNSFAWLESVEEQHAATDAALKNRAAATPKRGNDGYPASRRLRHVVRYLGRQKTRDPAVIQMLWQDAHRLFALPETQLGANHLLENYLSLWAAGMLFSHVPFLKRAATGLRRELPEQFLTDGAHYERSSHYTAQLIAALLRCLALTEALQSATENNLVPLCRNIIARGLGWLEQVQFAGSQMPAFGDAHRELRPTLTELKSAAGKLQIEVQRVPLSDSGYRVLENGDFSLCANVGTAAPAFQPGHSHADALSFALYFRGQPLICDVGISTYERNARRQWERSTAAHNTVEIDGENSAEIWAAFRMGRRATVKILRESPTGVSAVHDGYRHLEVLHQRHFSVGGNTVAIRDALTGNFKKALFRLYFPPEMVLELQGENSLLAGDCLLTFTGLEGAQLEPYEWAAGFNKTLPAVCFSAQFSGKVSTLLFKAATLPL